MSKSVIQLYPQSAEPVQLAGLYLARNLLTRRNNELPVVYANFLTSMDGRIAIKHNEDEYYQLPAQLKSNEDFSLLLELYAHADCIITHGGYMRALNAGRLGNVLQIPNIPETEYLFEWRKHEGLKPNPDVVIVSGSLDFPWHDSLDSSEQSVHIASGGLASEQRHQQWLQRGHEVHRFGDTMHVDVDDLMSFLQANNYRSVYLMAGPDLLQSMIEKTYVQHFFVTMSHQLLAGQSYKSLLNGGMLGNKGHLNLEHMYLDLGSSNSLSQCYMHFSFADN